MLLNTKLIKQKRIEKGMSQEQLGKALMYYGRWQISRIENGQLQDLPLSRVIMMSRVLEIEIQDLVKGGYRKEK